MADTFTPRGAPVPANSYDGWELTHRPAMLPFLAEYTNPLGETSGGWAMPEMVTEPVNALSRLLNTPAGTMPDIRDPQNQRDALTGLMALYGGNAVGGVARNALGKGVAHGLNMEAARPVAYSNAIDEAMSNPNMLSMMRDIDYANLNRRALDEYGVGYEGLTSSQEAKLRGWSDPGDVTFSSKNASIFDPPDKPQRAFEKDYKGAIPATHNWLLTHDIEGRPLTAKYVVGRQVAGESDVALSPEEYDAVTKALIGDAPVGLTQSELGKGNVGTYSVRPTEDGLVRSIGVLDTLSPDKAARVKAHEMGHMLEDLSGDFVRYENGVPVRVIPNDGILQKELKPLYNSLNNHNRQRPPGDDAASWAKPVTPDTFKYKNGEIPPEYMAEAIRAYLTNPNYIKTVAPKTAARIREYVNTNPRLKDIIQFNANASPLAGWLASGANALAQPEDP